MRGGGGEGGDLEENIVRSWTKTTSVSRQKRDIAKKKLRRKRRFPFDHKFGFEFQKLSCEGWNSICK